MSLEFDISKYQHLICDDIEPRQLELSDDSDIPSLLGNIPEKYRKPFVHPENGIVKKHLMAGNNGTEEKEKGPCLRRVRTKTDEFDKRGMRK